MLVEHGAKLDAGPGMLALNFAKGVAVTVEAPVCPPDTVALLKKLMAERGIPIPEGN